MRRLAWTALWLALAGAVGQALAQEAEDEEKKEKKDKPQRVVVTATRLLTPYEQVASDTTVISREQIERSHKTTVIELLRTVPAVDVAHNGGPGQTASVFLRGAKSEHTLVLIDGVEVNDPITPGRSFNWAHLTTDNIERIEIIRGPQSTLYGSDAMGGVINIITRRGRGRPRFSLSTEYGTYHTYKETAAVSGGTDLFHYAFTFSCLKSDGISAARRRDGNREKDAYENRTVAARLGLTPSESFELDVIFRYTEGETQLDSAGGPGGDDPNYESWTEQLFFRTQGRLLLFDEVWEQTFGVSYTDHDRGTRNDPDFAHPFDLERSSYDGKILRFDWQHNLYVHETNTVTFGLETEEETGSSRFYSDGFWGPFTSVFDEKKARTNSAYAQDLIKLWDRFFTTVGVRVDDHDRFGSETTWRVASTYLVKETGTRLKASYGTGFKAPTLFQLYSAYGDATLSPEKSKGCDVGVEQDLCDGLLTLGATCFRNRFENLIDYNSATWKYENISKAETKGVELTATVRPAERLSVQAAYTYTDTEDKTTGLELLRRAKNKASVELNCRLTEKANVNCGVLYIGKRKDMDFSTWPAARVTLDSYVLVNAGASYDVTKNVQVFGRIENCFNENYEEVKGYGTPGFGVFLGLKGTY